MKTEKSGYTLIELLVVIAIIAILAAMLLPAPGKTQSVSCLNVMKQNAPGYTLDEVVIAHVRRYPAAPPGTFFPASVTYWPDMPQPHRQTTDAIKCPTVRGDTAVSVSARGVKSKFPSII